MLRLPSRGMEGPASAGPAPELVAQKRDPPVEPGGSSVPAVTCLHPPRSWSFPPARDPGTMAPLQPMEAPMGKPRLVPPAPEVMATLYAEYLRRGRPFGL